MQDEADIIINGSRLSDEQSMTVRVAIDTLANVLAEGLSDDGDAEARALSMRYADALSHIQTLLESRELRKQ